jgi:hypothetical protein
MSRKLFLTITAVVASLIGVFALTAPSVLITSVKVAAPSETANVMARTVGILLITVGVLDFLVKDHEDSPTMRSVLIANLVLQIGIMPIDPSAYATGVYKTVGSFAPNTVLHVLLASGFIYFLAKMKRSDRPLASVSARAARAVE